MCKLTEHDAEAAALHKLLWDLEELQTAIPAIIPEIQTAEPLIPYLTESGTFFGKGEIRRASAFLTDIREELEAARKLKARTENTPGFVYSWTAIHYFYSKPFTNHVTGEELYPSRWMREDIGTHAKWRKAREEAEDDFLEADDLRCWPVLKKSKSGRYLYVLGHNGRQYRVERAGLEGEVFHSCGRVFSYSKPGKEYILAGPNELLTKLRKRMHDTHPEKGGNEREFIKARKQYEQLKKLRVMK